MPLFSALSCCLRKQGFTLGLDLLRFRHLKACSSMNTLFSSPWHDVLFVRVRLEQREGDLTFKSDLSNMHMAINEDQLAFLQEQLSDFGPFESKKMFGGVGFFREGIMFALLGKGVFHFRVDDENRGDYQARGMTGFMATEKKKGLPYFEVPVDILEDRSAMKTWASRAYEAAVRQKKK